MEQLHEFPLEICEVDQKTEIELKTHFKGLREFSGFVFVGPKKYLFPNNGQAKKQMTAIYNLYFKPDDIIISTFPRSGTTLTQELVWLLANDLDYKTSSSRHLIERYSVLGSLLINADKEVTKLEEYHNRKSYNILKRMVQSPTALISATEGRRFIKSHIPLSMMPPSADNAKMIYVARDPRDVAVSLYHFHRLLKVFEFEGDFKTFWNIFIRGLVIRAPYFDQIKEAWERRHNPNMLFIFYEDIIRNTSGTIQRICDFLNKKYTDQQIEGLSEHLKFGNFKKNPSVNLDFLEQFDAIVPGEQSFVRKGKAGDWREYFDEEMTNEAEIWIKENLCNTDLVFP